MSRPRKPTAILELTGSFQHDPQRRAARANEPKPTGELGNPPKHLTKDEKKIWKELASMAPAGVLANCDRWTVELACSLMAKQRNHDIKTQETGMLISILSKLGMTPADRSKVSALPIEQPTNEFAEFTSPNIQPSSTKVC